MKPVRTIIQNSAKIVNIGVIISVSNCKGCRYGEIKLKCLICEQADELNKEKYTPRQFSEIIQNENTPFPQLDPQERMIWVLYLANFTEQQIAQVSCISQSSVSRCITSIKIKLTP